MSWFTKLTGALFGSSDKGIVTEVSDAVDKWIPSETTKHAMGIEDLKAGDDSQASARAMQQPSHDSWFDIFVDGLNRLPRPLFTFWVFGILSGIIVPPNLQLNPILWNIVWTIITFWFGQRVLFKDLPAAWKHFKK